MVLWCKRSRIRAKEGDSSSWDFCAHRIPQKKKDGFVHILWHNLPSLSLGKESLKICSGLASVVTVAETAVSVVFVHLNEFYRASWIFRQLALEEKC